MATGERSFDYRRKVFWLQPKGRKTPAKSLQQRHFVPRNVAQSPCNNGIRQAKFPTAPKRAQIPFKNGILYHETGANSLQKRHFVPRSGCKFPAKTAFCTIKGAQISFKNGILYPKIAKWCCQEAPRSTIFIISCTLRMHIISQLRAKEAREAPFFCFI